MSTISGSQEYRESSAAVQAHLEIEQSIIQRMAANSASCKAWCITLVSAILVIIADKGKPQYALIAIIPILLFLLLDTYYLSLEKMFRQSYNSFIDKLHSGNIAITDLYSLSISRIKFGLLLSAFLSFAIWPFYLMLTTITLVVIFCMF